MVARFLPYFTDVIVPDLRVGKTVLIVAHGNSLRALVKYLDGMSDDDITGLNIPTGIPLRYDLDADMRPLVAGGSYLDPDAAAEGRAQTGVFGARPRWPAKAPNRRQIPAMSKRGVNGPRTPVSWRVT